MMLKVIRKLSLASLLLLALAGVSDAAYSINVRTLVPPPAPVDWSRIQLADQTGTTAVQDLGAARSYYILAKVKIKTAGTSPTFTLQSADNSGFSTNVNTLFISQTQSTTGTIIVDGWIDNPQEFIKLVIGGTAGSLVYDVEFDYMVVK